MVVSAHLQPASALVGRTREVAELDLALDRLAADSPWSVQIVGEPGIGKSRLLAELTSTRRQARGYLVLRGRAAEFELDVPFAVVLDALNDYFGTLEPAFLQSLGPETLGELAAIFPSLAASVDTLPAPRLQSERYRIHYAIRALLERLAERRPMVVIIDDVQWADAASVEMIAHVLRRFRGPVMGAFAYRYPPAGLAVPFDMAVRAGVGGRLELAPLTEEQAESLMDPALDPELRALLYHESGGNPFYLEELMRSGHAAAPRSSAGDRRSRRRLVAAAGGRGRDPRRARGTVARRPASRGCRRGRGRVVRARVSSPSSPSCRSRPWRSGSTSCSRPTSSAPPNRPGTSASGIPSSAGPSTTAHRARGSSVRTRAPRSRSPASIDRRAPTRITSSGRRSSVTRTRSRCWSTARTKSRRTRRSPPATG